MNRLLGERKLSLVVDLDQTVLHATVDSAVNDWLQDASHPNHQHVLVLRNLFLI
jgi:RNA polymerase II subunit A-like phosphatase